MQSGQPGPGPALSLMYSVMWSGLFPPLQLPARAAWPRCCPCGLEAAEMPGPLGWLCPKTGLGPSGLPPSQAASQPSQCWPRPPFFLPGLCPWSRGEQARPHAVSLGHRVAEPAGPWDMEPQLCLWRAGQEEQHPNHSEPSGSLLAALLRSLHANPALPGPVSVPAVGLGGRMPVGAKKNPGVFQCFPNV